MFLRKRAGAIKRLMLECWRNRYLAKCSGVIHVGANTGQERGLYARFRLPVIWIEPIAEQFAALKQNIAEFQDQRAIQALITDKDNAVHTLHIASNDGASSSILDFHMHKDIWPDVGYNRDVTLISKTLASAIRGIDCTNYDILVLDTQGSELMILRGAEQMLRQFRYIKTEAADFESYLGGATVPQITDYLGDRGFKLSRSDTFARHPSGGQYFDLLFARA